MDEQRQYLQPLAFGTNEAFHSGFTPKAARKRSKRMREMTEWRPRRSQQAAKPLYSARGPSLRIRLASEWRDPVRALDLSDIILTLITSTGWEQALHAKPERRKDDERRYEKNPQAVFKRIHSPATKLLAKCKGRPSCMPKRFLN